MDTEERLYSQFKEFITADDSPYYFYIHDSEGIFTYISESIFDILGFTPDEFKSFYLDHTTANPINKEMIRYTQNALNGLKQDPYEVEVYDKTYQTHRLLVYERPIVEEDGKVVGVEGVAKLLS